MENPFGSGKVNHGGARMKKSKREYSLSAVFWREGKQMVGVCPEIGVSTCGRNLEHTKRELKDAVELYLSNAGKLGMLDELEDALMAKDRFASTLEISA